ncbi:hypothetical protein JCM8097_002116 [Rhodosporidiobolus ruineniae]
MSSPSSTPFYGLFVHTLPLILAAQAWPKLKGPLKALDWISARRTDGVLDIEEGSETLKTVPSEVWEMIKPTLAYCFKLDDETSELLSVREGDLMAGQGRGEDMMNEVGAAVSQTSSAPRWVGWETERAGDGS